MAEKVTGGEKKTRKKKDDGPGMGHNLTDIKKKAEPAIAEIIKKFDDMASDMGAYKNELKELYKSRSETIGCRPGLLRGLVHDILTEREKLRKLKEMEPSERVQLETLQASLAGTPFGDYVRERVIN